MKKKNQKTFALERVGIVPTRNIVLSDRHDAMGKSLLAEGHYQNASDVLREGLRLIEERDALHAEKLAPLKAAVKVGADAVAAGHYTDFASYDDLDAHLKAIQERRALALPG